MFEGIPARFGQAVYINAAATGSTPSTFFGRGWPDTGGVAPSAVGMEMRSDDLLALPSRRWIEYGVRLHDICGFRTDRGDLWLAVVGSTILAFLFNFFSYGGLVFGNTSYRLFPGFLAFYTSLGGLNFLLLRSLTSGGFGAAFGAGVVASRPCSGGVRRHVNLRIPQSQAGRSGVRNL